MDFSMEDTQNSAPNQPTMAEQAKLNGIARKADTQSVTKRSVLTVTVICPLHEGTNWLG